MFVCCYLHLDRWEFQEGFFTCSVCILLKIEGKMAGKGISDLLLAGFFFLLQMKSPRHRGQLMDQFCTPVELSSSYV